MLDLFYESWESNKGQDSAQRIEQLYLLFSDLPANGYGKVSILDRFIDDLV